MRRSESVSNRLRAHPSPRCTNIAGVFNRSRTVDGEDAVALVDENYRMWRTRAKNVSVRLPSFQSSRAHLGLTGSPKGSRKEWRTCETRARWPLRGSQRGLGTTVKSRLVARRPLDVNLLALRSDEPFLVESFWTSPASGGLVASRVAFERSTARGSPRSSFVLTLLLRWLTRFVAVCGMFSRCRLWRRFPLL